MIESTLHFAELHAFFERLDSKFNIKSSEKRLLAQTDK